MSLPFNLSLALDSYESTVTLPVSVKFTKIRLAHFEWTNTAAKYQHCAIQINSWNQHTYLGMKPSGAEMLELNLFKSLFLLPLDGSTTIYNAILQDVDYRVPDGREVEAKQLKINFTMDENPASTAISPTNKIHLVLQFLQ